MQVVKASGELEKFDFRKIKRTCIKAGCSDELANDIAREVQRRAYEGITTREVLRITLSLLNKRKPYAAIRYDLKGAIFRLGPAGFVFEELVGEILKEYGYSVKVHCVIKGMCVSHEIDVVASKDGSNYMIECKYHNVPGIYTGLKESLYTYARLLDLKDNFKSGGQNDFSQAWLVCNTKFSEDAVKYASCKGMRLIGWNYPEGQGLEYMIESKKLYPITMLRDMDADTLSKMSSSNFILALDLLRVPISEINKITKIPIKKLKTLYEEAKELIQP
ncbi:MAG: restriction endonuclease [Candidatus Aenigmatarchaeota archaeon]